MIKYILSRLYLSLPNAVQPSYSSTSSVLHRSESNPYVMIFQYTVNDNNNNTHRYDVSELMNLFYLFCDHIILYLLFSIVFHNIMFDRSPRETAAYIYYIMSV